MKSLHLVALAFAFAAMPVAYATPPNTIRVPVTEQVQECTDTTNLAGAAVGAGVGYVGGKVAQKAFGSRSGLWSLGGAAAGALIGANTNQEKSCTMVQKTIGYKVITSLPNGRLQETFEPVK